MLRPGALVIIDLCHHQDGHPMGCIKTYASIAFDIFFFNFDFIFVL